MAIGRPRTSRQPSSSSPSKLLPSNSISPASVRTLSGSSPIRACAHIDLPDPDSPTTQTISPATRSSETPSTAEGRSLPGGSAIFRFLIEMDEVFDISASIFAEPRVERVVEAFADQVQAEHRDEDGDAGKHRDPPRLPNHRPSGADHVTPRDQIGI